MKNKTHTAIEMIADGHSVEIVMDVLGIEQDEMLEILNKVLGIKVLMAEYVSEVIKSKLMGRFEVNMN